MVLFPASDNAKAKQILNSSLRVRIATEQKCLLHSKKTIDYKLGQLEHRSYELIGASAWPVRLTGSPLFYLGMDGDRLKPERSYDLSKTTQRVCSP